jgi:hypothetical protein
VEPVAHEAPPRRVDDLAAPGVEMLLRYPWHGTINLKRMIVLDKQQDREEYEN